jgi:hypothetical protein
MTVHSFAFFRPSGPETPLPEQEGCGVFFHAPKNPLILFSSGPALSETDGFGKAHCPWGKTEDTPVQKYLLSRRSYGAGPAWVRLYLSMSRRDHLQIRLLGNDLRTPGGHVIENDIVLSDGIWRRAQG